MECLAGQLGGPHPMWKVLGGKKLALKGHTFAPWETHWEEMGLCQLV